MSGLKLSSWFWLRLPLPLTLSVNLPRRERRCMSSVILLPTLPTMQFSHWVSSLEVIYQITDKCRFLHFNVENWWHYPLSKSGNTIVQILSASTKSTNYVKWPNSESYILYYCKYIFLVMSHLNLQQSSYSVCWLYFVLFIRLHVIVI